MKIKFARFGNFRNVEFAEVEFGGKNVWICGQNAQGKTNLLEGLGLLTALRSFRSSDGSAMIAHRKTSAQLLIGLTHEKFGECEIQIDLERKRKQVFIDSVAVPKLSDFIGKFPVVALTCDDIRLVRGSPELRRRDMDIFISGLDAEYLDALRIYHRALAQRNALLKNSASAAEMFEAFEIQMAHAAVTIYAKREKWLGMIAESATQKYALLAAENGEAAKISLRRNCKFDDEKAYLQMLRDNRSEDFLMRSTSKGCHRDDFSVSVADHDAKSYASEGQQRSAVLAVKLAQFDIYAQIGHAVPVLLCDDVFSELDAFRRRAFWNCLNPDAQIIATATHQPPTDSPFRWLPINVSNGKFSRTD